MKFDPNGKSLIVEMKFGGHNYAVCIFKFRVQGGAEWKVAQTFDSRIANQTYVLDPSDLIGPGKTISDFSGSSIGWFYVADEPKISTPNGTIDYKFSIDIVQGGNKLDTFSVNANGVKPPVLLSNIFNF